jgi:hypothetical protein
MERGRHPGCCDVLPAACSAPIGEVLVDFAVDSPPTGPPFVTSLAPTYPLGELAARKALALFDRAAARDFADLLSLSRHFDVDAILTDAADLDPGFDRAVFAQMLDTIERFTDDELRATSADSGELRQFTPLWPAGCGLEPLSALGAKNTCPPIGDYL